MSVKITIIIPVYNTEHYLRRCLDSVLNQNYDDWECIMVDDGSIDGSGDICDEYAAADSRFRVFHKVNGGVSSARNVGLDNADGEWICFADSDDTFSSDALTHMVGIAEDTSADVCICKLMQTVPDTDEVKILDDDERHKLIWSCLAFRTREYWGCGYRVDGPVAKLFKGSLIRARNQRYVLGLSRSEDAIFDAYCYHYAKTIVMSDHSVYHYQCNPNSLTHTFNSKLPATLSSVLAEELTFADTFEDSSYREAVYVRAFVGMYQIISELGEKGLPFKRHLSFLVEYLDSEVVHNCMKGLPYRLVKQHFVGPSQPIKLFLSKNKQAFLILLWLRIRY